MAMSLYGRMEGACRHVSTPTLKSVEKQIKLITFFSSQTNNNLKGLILDFVLSLNICWAGHGLSLVDV